MQANPKKNRVHMDEILVEQFRRKGYHCKEIKEVNATIFIITHEYRQAAQLVNETYKNLLKTN